MEGGEVIMDETTVTEYTIPDVTEVIPEETAAETLATEPDNEELILTIQEVGSGIVYADLLGSFILCGTLVGLVLWRGLHGN